MGAGCAPSAPGAVAAGADDSAGDDNAGDSGDSGVSADDTGGPDDTGGADETGIDPDPRCPNTDDGAEPEPIHEHRVQSLRSQDGLSFQTTDAPELLHASVPDAFLLDGEPHAIVVDGTPGRHGLWMARDDDGLALVDCVLVDGVWDPFRVDPDVVSTDGGVRLYWLEGVAPGEAPPETRRVWTASSTDGHTFVDARVALEWSTLTDPSVARGPDGRWWMAISVPGYATRLARSDDGLDFQLTGTRIPGDKAELHGTPDGLRLYVTIDGDIESLRSTDGQTWQADDGVRWAGVASPSVLEVDGELRMLVVSHGEG
jgi:hypothetical protein